MARTYSAGPGSLAPTNPIRAVASPYRTATMSKVGLILDIVYHAESLTEKKRIDHRSHDRVIKILRRVPNRRGWSTPEQYGGSN